jgi:hypothetical protein
MRPRPGLVVFDVNETLSDMAPLAARFAEAGGEERPGGSSGNVASVRWGICQWTVTGGVPSSSSRCVSSCLRGSISAGMSVRSTITHATQ